VRARKQGLIDDVGVGPDHLVLMRLSADGIGRGAVWPLPLWNLTQRVQTEPLSSPSVQGSANSATSIRSTSRVRDIELTEHQLRTRALFFKAGLEEPTALRLEFRGKY
jgi:hypothetical protein